MTSNRATESNFGHLRIDAMFGGVDRIMFCYFVEAHGIYVGSSQEFAWSKRQSEDEKAGLKYLLSLFHAALNDHAIWSVY
jgi:hypothetical protein